MLFSKIIDINYDLCFAAIEDKSLLAERKVIAPMTRRYFRVSNMFNFNQKQMNRANIAEKLNNKLEKKKKGKYILFNRI